MMKRTTILLAVILLGTASWATADESEIIKSASGGLLKGARGFDVEADLRNDQATFGVRVAVNHKDRTYAKGELMKVSVVSEKSGYLYLLYKQADGSTKCLFPNVYESDNSIKAGSTITIPTANQKFKLRCNKPYGNELLVAVVSKRPLAVERLGVKSLTKSVVTDVDPEALIRSLKHGEIPKGMDIEGDMPAVETSKWAEHSVSIKTMARRRSGDVKPQHRRIGLFIGISDYKDSRIRDLHLCHKDAIIMAAIMKEHGKLDGVGILVNEKATRANIKKAFRELKLKSNPGDEIFIYWSGHGASCADTGGDEADGRDEFLIPHDGNVDKLEETMVLDDAFGRWIQELDGRKVVVILDACHSGGQATDKGVDSIKGEGIVSNSIKLPSGSVDEMLKSVDDIQWGVTPTPKDFLDSELGRIKDIGQGDANMLFSSASDEISAERRDGKLSVMTYFLAKKIADSRSLTLKEAYDYVKVEVPKYMKKHFPGREQTPQLCPQGSATDVKLK